MLGHYKKICLGLFVTFGLVSELVAKPKPQIPVTAEVEANIKKAIPVSLVGKLQKKKKILVFSKCGGFVHSSIDVGKALFKQIGETFPNIEVSFDDNPENYTKENLAKYDAIVNLNATHISKTFADPQRKALLDFISEGKSFIGIHAASDAGDWPEYT